MRGEKGGVSSAGPARKGGAGGAKTAAKGKAGADFGKKVKKISNFIQIREENGCKYGRGGYNKISDVRMPRHWQGEKENTMGTPPKEFDVRLRLQQLMDARGWSISELSRKSGIAQSTLAMMAMRDNQPSLTTIKAVCTGMGITLEQFFRDGDAGYGEDCAALLEDFSLMSADRQRIVRELVHAMAHPAVCGEAASAGG